ncbi:hypothetical protein CFR72_11435 [Gluconacetobacter entanii]|uniref:TIR domain-containing protein n=2 Tax=Gluconacetobacter entanii TaxID=108528 RepID=A0A318PRP9_9PROT|nr:hypothetical protein CFR72_11435 [Gluconacetobacter entanii]
MANALRDWLPMVLQYVEPFVSDKDISAGERWAQAISGELEASNFGIICITPENISSEWILFESGALSKSMSDGKVIPLLFGLELSDLSGPLSQFQAQKAEEAGIMEIVKSINKVAEKPASDQIVNQLVPSLWPKFKSKLDEISSKTPVDKHKRPQHEILEELVKDVRGIGSVVRDMQMDSGDEEKTIRKQLQRWHPRVIHEFVMASQKTDDPGVGLLLLSGLIKDELPWLSELLTETYRETRSANKAQVGRILQRTKMLIKMLYRDGIAYKLSNVSKNTMMLMEEMVDAIDFIFSNILNSKSSAGGRKSIVD